MPSYEVPENPTDPEAAALNLIVQLPAQVFGSDAFTAPLQDFCGVLHAEGALAGLAWRDARHVAAAVSFDVVSDDDAPTLMRHRARSAFSGADGLPWLDASAAARAFNLAASGLDRW